MDRRSAYYFLPDRRFQETRFPLRVVKSCYSVADYSHLQLFLRFRPKSGIFTMSHMRLQGTDAIDTDGEFVV